MYMSVQDRNRFGQFGSRTVNNKSLETGEKKVVKKFRIDESTARRGSILFQHHFKEMSWQTLSDMDRNIYMVGIAAIESKIKNPTKEMLAAKRRAEALEEVESQVRRHTEFEQESAMFQGGIEVANRAGDLFAVRKILEEYQALIAEIDDPAIRVRREVEFESRFRRHWDSVNINVRLDPDKFSPEDDK